MHISEMEVQANEFASLILMPPRLLKAMMRTFRDPQLDQIITIAREFNVSKEAAARAYAMYHEQCVAIVVVHNETIDRIYRNIITFPRMSVEPGQAVPRHSIFHYVRGQMTISSIEEGDAGAWLETEWGKALPELYDQVLFQQDGYALILLWAEVKDEDQEIDEDRTAKQRLQDRQRQWR